MKLLIAIFLLFNSNYNMAQDTLYLPVPSLGDEKYVLYEDGTFIYNSHLCGSYSFSYGNYKKNLFGYRFKYDTTKCPFPSIVQLKQEPSRDSITLFFYNFIDSLSQPFFGQIIIGNQQVNSMTNSIVISINDLNSDTLIINKLSFTFDTTCSEIKIYIPPNGFGYNCGINDLKNLKKTRHGYLQKFNVYDENKEKPWKKKKRKVRHYYQLLD